MGKVREGTGDKDKRRWADQAGDSCSIIVGFKSLPMSIFEPNRCFLFGRGLNSIAYTIHHTLKLYSMFIPNLTRTNLMEFTGRKLRNERINKKPGNKESRRNGTQQAGCRLMMGRAINLDPYW